MAYSFAVGTSLRAFQLGPALAFFCAMHAGPAHADLVFLPAFDEEPRRGEARAGYERIILPADAAPGPIYVARLPALTVALHEIESVVILQKQMRDLADLLKKSPRELPLKKFEAEKDKWRPFYQAIISLNEAGRKRFIAFAGKQRGQRVLVRFNGYPLNFVRIGPPGDGRNIAVHLYLVGNDRKHIEHVFAPIVDSLTWKTE